MSRRAADIFTALAWGVPLNVWDGTGDVPTEEQKAEMVAGKQARDEMEAWESRVNAPKKRGEGITIGA